MHGTDWIVTDGLLAGDQIAVNSLGMIQPGAALQPTPAQTPIPTASGRAAARE
jgi:hypothetical protein